MSRYANQIAVNGFGERGQQRLSAETVYVFGLGGVGCVVAEYLMRAGVGTLLISDPDTVDLPNLARQTLYTEDDVGSRKDESALKALSKMNSDVNLFTTPHDAHAYRQGKSVTVIDCVDDPVAKVEIDTKRPDDSKFLSCGMGVWRGQMIVQHGRTNLSLFDLYDGIDIKNQKHIVLGPIAGMMGCMMAHAAIAAISGMADRSYIQTIHFDDLSTHMMELQHA